MVQGDSHCLYHHARKEVIEKCCKRFSDLERQRKLRKALRSPGAASGNAPDTPDSRADGLNFTEAFLHHSDVGREYLGKFLYGVRTEPKRHLIHWQSLGRFFRVPKLAS